MSNVFIIGEAGFIGAHLVKRIAQDHAVMVHDNFAKDTLGTLGYDKLPNVQGSTLLHSHQ